MNFAKLAVCGILPYILSFSAEASSSDNCPGKCPLNAFDYAEGHGSRIELKIDDYLVENPVTSGVEAMSGWAEYLGFDSATTQQFWRTGLDYIDWRFGLDTSAVTFDPVLGIAFLTVDANGVATQTPNFVPGTTNVVITPLTFNQTVYRAIESVKNDHTIRTEAGCRPWVRLVEFVITFVGPTNLHGTYGSESSDSGFVTVSSGGLAFGTWVIRRSDGYDEYFDFRSWLPNISFPGSTTSTKGYFSERFQVNPLNREDFGGSGIGTLTIVAPTGPTTTPDGPRYRWFIRNDWWFGPIVSYPELVDWDTPPGNISLIRPTGRFARKCNDVPQPLPTAPL